MDNDFMEKLKSISEFEKISENEDQFAFSATFHKEIDGMIKITADKGECSYQLRPIEELYARQDSSTKDEEQLMPLLYHIERTIKEYYSRNKDLTDSSIILALEQLSMKPEAPAQSDFLKDLTNNLRMFMSMHNLSRSQLRQGINRILRSAKRHNKIDGMRGYLGFIINYVP